MQKIEICINFFNIIICGAISMKTCYKGTIYLSLDMERLGHLFEFCDVYAKNNFNADINRYVFADKFMKSELRALMDIGHPKLLSQAAEDTFIDYVEWELKGDISSLFGNEDKYKDDFVYLELYWIGKMYALSHCKTRLPSKVLIDKLNILQMRHFYVCGHEMSWEVAYDKIKEAFI